MFNITLLISILLHYSYIKTIKLLPTDTLNSKIVPVCEFLSLIQYMLRKNTLPLMKKHHKSFPGKQCNHKHLFFIFINCRTDKNHVHIESLYLIGYQYNYLVWAICIEFVITCLLATQFTYVILLICCTLVLLNTIYSLKTKTKQLKGKLKCYSIFRIFTLPGLLPSISY